MDIFVIGTVVFAVFWGAAMIALLVDRAARERAWREIAAERRRNWESRTPSSR